MADPTHTPLTWAEEMELTHLPARPEAIAAHILASEWHAARVAAARADERERITAAIRWLIHSDATDDEHVKVGDLRAALAQPTKEADRG